MAEPILEMKGISKHFGSKVALDNVDLTAYPGEIRGLIGENGSGKSTISSIAAGMQRVDKGEMLYHGRTWVPGSMIESLSGGIGMIVQESGTIAGISVAENLFSGETKQFRGVLGTVDRKAMNAKVDEALDAIDVKNVRGATPMGALDFQTRKLVEIAKVIMKQPEILVVDETTTALSQEGRTILYNLMKRLRDGGNAVVFISHNLDEIMEVCDTKNFMLAFFSLFCSGNILYMLITRVTEYATDFGASTSIAGLVSSIYIIAGLIARFYSSTLLRRLGWRKMIFLSQIAQLSACRSRKNGGDLQ